MRRRVFMQYGLHQIKKQKILKIDNDMIDSFLFIGLPYAAIPIATAVSLQGNYPMIYPRKEVKTYGTKAEMVDRLTKEARRRRERCRGGGAARRGTSLSATARTHR